MSNSPINLYEYAESSEYTGDAESLDKLLQHTWVNRERQSHYRDEDGSDSKEQQLLRIIYDSKGNATLKAKQYIGTISTFGKAHTTINIHPKIFSSSNAKSYTVNDNILYWLSYSKRLRVPKYISGADSRNNDLLEIFIYIFSSYTKKLFATNLYQNYTDISRDLSVVRGRINMPRYINNLAVGNMHRIACDYQRFQFDNRFNRLVKYVSKLLLSIAKNPTTRKNLKDILFVLDGVKDIQATAQDCDKIRFNQMQSDFQTVLDYCRLFLSNSVSYGATNKLKVFILLFDMNVLYEEFIAGFVAKHFSQYSFESQYSRMKLTTNKYTLKPDLYSERYRIIIDTKNKIIDPNGIVSQNDLYQMAAYAIRFKCKNLVLLYPKPHYRDNDNRISRDFIITDEFSDTSINIHIREIDIVYNGKNGELINEQLRNIVGESCNQEIQLA